MVNLSRYSAESNARKLKCVGLPLRRRSPFRQSQKQCTKQQYGEAIYTFAKSRSRSRKKKAYRCSKFNAYCLLSYREHAMLIFCLCAFGIKVVYTENLQMSLSTLQTTSLPYVILLAALSVKLEHCFI